MQVPVEVWHIEKRIKDRIRVDNTKESKALLRHLSLLEFFSNAFSYAMVISAIIASVSFALLFGKNSLGFPPVVIGVVIAFFFGDCSGRLQILAINAIERYFRKKH